jgi:aminoglycoside phosphotransferase (APT) family kinase protein
VDWVNAGAGDPRQDLARSLAILRLDVPNVLASSLAAVAVLQSLEEPWVAGYEAVAGRQEDMATFLAWAGLRTLRDLAGERSPDEFASMRAEVEQWIVAAQKSRDA